MALMPVRTIGLLLAGGLCLGAMAAEPDASPPPRKVDTVDRAFGLVLPDPYRWMEGASNPEFDAWLKREGAGTRARLDALPQRAKWLERLRSVGASTVDHTSQTLAGGRIFFLRREGGREAVLMVRDPDGAQQTLLDPNDAQGSSITTFAPSFDGRRVAINVDRSGGELSSIRILDVATAKPLADVVDDIWGEFSANWLPDGSGFTYTQMRSKAERGDRDPLLDMRVRLHRLGSPVAEDPILITTGSSERAPMSAQEFPGIYSSPQSPWKGLVFSGARSEIRLCVAPGEESLSAGTAWNCLVGYEDLVEDARLYGSTLYLLSRKGAPNGRVLALDLSQPKPKLADARVLLPEAAEEVVKTLASARDALYVVRMRGGIDRVLRIAHDTGKAEPIALPFDGSLDRAAADPSADGLLVSLAGWTRPKVTLFHDPIKSSLVDLHLGTTAPADYQDLESVEVEATSADGSRVPLSIIRKKQAKSDGSALAILQGYGGYGYSIQPSFDPMVLEWVKAGNVYAMAHVRGGGEKGLAWTLGGKSANKQRGVEDFIACARQLVAMGLTRADHIGARGQSMGAILVGGAMTTAPEHFGAFTISVGVLNPVRLLESHNGANQLAELADPRTPEGLRVLAAMDPYQRIREAVRYPPVMLIIGLKDNRVSPWESGKFGARLMSAGPTPVWFRVDEGSGHFATSGLEKAAERSDLYSFLESQLGKGP